jgi:hypothetical protein
MVWKFNRKTLTVFALLCFLTVSGMSASGTATYEIPETSEKLKPGMKYMIMVDCETHTLYLFHEGKAIKKYTVACGKKDTPSPIGLWKIVNKARWGEGFGGYWLGLNVPWGMYGLHGTLKPTSIGRNSSHGCIRMQNRDIAELYRLVSYGTEVLIVNGEFGVFGKGFRNIKPGDRGADVFAVQRQLNRLGYDCGKPDGIYGERMKKAVFEFQKDHGLLVSNIITRSMLEKMGFREFE